MIFCVNVLSILIFSNILLVSPSRLIKAHLDAGVLLQPRPLYPCCFWPPVPISFANALNLTYGLDSPGLLCSF